MGSEQCPIAHGKTDTDNDASTEKTNPPQPSSGQTRLIGTKSFTEMQEVAL
jgi:hypothetical protein